MTTLAEHKRQELAGKLKLTSVSVTSLMRNKHCTIFIMARHDERGAVHIDQALLMRTLEKHGFQPQERCNYA